jgi:CubicO group peptidase (beta-lactamase class C family)
MGSLRHLKKSLIANAAAPACLALVGLVSGTGLSAQSLYFPSSDDQWEHIDPASAGWNAALLSAALDLAGERDSSGMVILYRGRIMAERYWELDNPSRRYQNAVQGRDGKGRAIEDVASAQKSIVAVLTGMAQERGLINIEDPVGNHLGKGWSQASEEQEAVITIRHLLSMNSGLATDMSFSSAPGETWLYNTPAYHYLMRILEAVTGKDRNQLTSEWITEPLGMEHSSWTPRPWADAAIGSGFSTTARELARFGLMIQAGGRWHDQVIIADRAYLEAMLSASQNLNPAYGFLWWVNGQEFSLGAGAGTRRSAGPLIPAAPDDLVAMQGALDRKLYLVPSLDLVVVRLGAAGSAGNSNFNNAFWTALMAARE